MIVRTDQQAIIIYCLLTAMLLHETYRVSDLEDALVWTAPES